MGVKYLWDTNTVIYYLQQQFSPSAEKFVDGLVVEARPCISAITEIELLCWKTATEADLTVLNSFINDALVIELEQVIKIRTAEIRKHYPKLKLPDAIIAATALVYQLTLVTRNAKDFEQVTGLLTIDPWEK